MSRIKIAEPVGYLDPEERWKMLGTAIVCQAIYDWKEAANKLKNGQKHKSILEQKNSAEHFIVSQTCELYCGHDGKTIMRRLKQQQRSA